jgi:hypothetical protein
MNATITAVGERNSAGRPAKTTFDSPRFAGNDTSLVASHEETDARPA